MSKYISREDLQSLIASGEKHTIVEALPEQYYELEHLPGAINIPLDEVTTAVSNLIPDKNRPVIVYCANTECINSHTAAETMRELGYSSVFEYAEGKKGWKEAGLPVENGGGSI